jgi:hypothetical protein
MVDCRAVNGYHLRPHMLEQSNNAGLDLDAEVWDGQAELFLAATIRRYLSLTPPPPGSRIAQDLETYSRNLELDGRARLLGAGARRFRLVQ